ncbi:MAG: two-component system response regulator MprA [Chloroflexota bacterium]
MREAVKILCVDDDAYLTDLLRYALTREGYDIAVAHGGADALRMIASDPPHLVLLDGTLPDGDGFELCTRMRAELRLPVIMLTARQADEDILLGLGNGADDYISKPFNMQILVYRVRAVLRRVAATTPLPQTAPTVYPMGTGTYDTAENALIGCSARVKLTRMEGHILSLLLAHEGQVFAAERILEHVAGFDTDSDATVIKTHIRHLRVKLAQALGAADLVQTVRGVGYICRREPASSSLRAIA